MENNITPKSWTFKPVSRSLHEIAELLKVFNAASTEAQEALGIALTTAAIRMLEGVANTILFAVPINKKLKEPLDRLKWIDKFDLCLYLRVQKQLDRGHHLLGSITTMIKGRDELTHPYPLETEFDSIDRDPTTGTVQFKTEKNPYAPTKEDALHNLRAILAFLDEYLIRWCKCDASFLSMLMSETTSFSDGSFGIFQLKHLVEDKNILESMLSVKIEFLKYLSNP